MHTHTHKHPHVCTHLVVDDRLVGHCHGAYANVIVVGAQAADGCHVAGGVHDLHQPQVQLLKGHQPADGARRVGLGVWSSVRRGREDGLSEEVG